MKEEFKYKISKVPPPIYEKAIKKFPVDFYDNVVFTYGDTIHIANPNQLTKDLIVHESVHIRQQMSCEGGPEAWWDKYLNDDSFRLGQELEAYRAQYAWVLTHENKRLHWQRLRFYAESLCKAYDLKDIHLLKAMDLIKAVV